MLIVALCFSKEIFYDEFLKFYCELGWGFSD